MTNNFLPKPKTYRERVPRLLLEAIALPPVFLPHLRRLRIPHVPHDPIIVLNLSEGGVSSQGDTSCLTAFA